MFKNFDEAVFKDQLSESNLDEILATSDANSAANLLVKKLTGVLDKMAPVSTIQTRAKYAAWPTDSTKDLQQERDTAHEKAAASDNPEDWR